MSTCASRPGEGLKVKKVKLLMGLRRHLIMQTWIYTNRYGPMRRCYWPSPLNRPWPQQKENNYSKIRRSLRGGRFGLHMVRSDLGMNIRRWFRSRGFFQSRMRCSTLECTVTGNNTLSGAAVELHRFGCSWHTSTEAPQRGGAAEPHSGQNQNQIISDLHNIDVKDVKPWFCVDPQRMFWSDWAYACSTWADDRFSS